MAGSLNHGQSNALRVHLDTRLDALEALLADAVQRRQAELMGRDYGLPHAAAPAWTPMRTGQEAVWPLTQPEPHSERAGGGRRGGGSASGHSRRAGGRHAVRERDVALLERLGFEAAEAEHALGAAEPDPLDATASRVECAVRWLCRRSQHPRDVAQGESRTKAGSPARTAVLHGGSLEHAERLQRASGLHSGRTGAGATLPQLRGEELSGEQPEEREGHHDGHHDGDQDGHQYLSPPAQRHGGAPATPPPPAWAAGWAAAAAASSPTSPPAVPSPLPGEERERRRLLAVLSHAPSAEVLAALQARLLCPPGPASSAAVAMLGALLPAEDWPGHWTQVLAGPGA